MVIDLWKLRQLPQLCPATGTGVAMKSNTGAMVSR